MGAAVARRLRRESDAPALVAENRLVVRGSVHPAAASAMADDVARGLRSMPKAVPPKYFYDARGAQLFDEICHTPEYYVTRTEQALLDDHAHSIVRAAAPTHLVELGSGAARKTRTLLEAMHAESGRAVYAPLDISEEILIASGRALLADYPWLTIEGTVQDFEHRIGDLPSGRRMFAFLGGTLGNFDHLGAVAFLARIRRAMGPDDSFLLGIDMVKSPAVLHAAYNDEAGITAAFNRNVLDVMNDALGANFDTNAFGHVAFYRSDLEQIEMHLEATRPMTVTVPGVGMSVRFAAGERLHTEISRKFTPASAELMIKAAGLRVQQWHTPANKYFSLILLRAG